MQKTILLALIQKEIQQHDFSYFVDEPPSVAQDGSMQKKDQSDATVLGPSLEGRDASIA